MKKTKEVKYVEIILTEDDLLLIEFSLNRLHYILKDEKDKQIRKLFKPLCVSSGKLLTRIRKLQQEIEE